MYVIMNKFSSKTLKTINVQTIELKQSIKKYD